MATDYKIVVVQDTGGTRPGIKCPQCLRLQLLYAYRLECSYTVYALYTYTQDHNDCVEGLHQKLSKDQGNKSMDVEQVCLL